MERTDIIKEHLAKLVCEITGHDIDCSGFELLPIMHQGIVVGAIMLKGNEIHVAVKPEFHGKWFGKWAIGVLSALLDEHGVMETSVRKTNIAGQRFVARVGFKLTNENDSHYLYELK